MSKYIYRFGHWFRNRRNRDIGVKAAETSIPSILETYSLHRENSTAQMLAGTRMMH